MGVDLPAFLRPTAPDTVRVGAHAFLLVNAGYTEAVALVGDTVWVLDATQGEERAQQDSAWIGKLFPGRHPVAVVRRGRRRSRSCSAPRRSECSPVRRSRSCGRC